MSVFTTNGAADWLDREVPGKTPEYWRQFLINNRRTDRAPLHRLEFATSGRRSTYKEETLRDFVRFEKSRRVGELRIATSGTAQPGDLLDAMIHLATNLFHGKKDKAGKPYILHCLKVMHYVKSEEEELLCIAIGHDILEDCFNDIALGISVLRDKGFTERIIEGILAMTKRPGQAYEDYKAQVKRNADARKVKMADLRHNSDIRRLKGVTVKDIERTVRYHQFYLELEALG